MSDKYSKRRIRSSSLTTIVSLSLVLFMLGLVGLLILNTKKITDVVKENIGFNIIMNDNAKDKEIEQLKKNMDQSSYVKSSEYVTKEQAAAIVKESVGEDFISFLGFNPLLASINVHLNAGYANIDSVAKIEARLSKNKLVREIWYQKSLVSMVNENVRKISAVILAFSGILMLIALALINNTIRLSIYSKRFLIKTMQLVGATRGFIRRPFVFKGIKHGIYSAFVAIGLLFGLIYFVKRQSPEFAQIQDDQMLAILFSSIILLGILISWISTSMAVRKYLSLNTDELYY